MTNKLVLFLTVSLLLCACTRKIPQEEIQACPTSNGLSYTEYTEPQVTAEESVFETVETMIPLHSELYHPDYTSLQIREYFEEVVLNVEYTDGIGDATLVQKWTEPIGYRLFGTPTEEDLAVLNALFVRLNQISGFPGIYETEDGAAEQLRISFLDQDVFRASYSSVVNGEEATGATEFWYYTDTNEIYSARIGYRTDIDQKIRNSVLIEEVINTLGISDTVRREDSVTYQYSDDNTALSDVDWILLNLLYHPDMLCGMDAESCASVIQRLYY